MNIKIKTPCVRDCYYNHDLGFCEGCFRTLKEIGDWRRLSEEEKNIIMENCDKRKNEFQDKNNL